MKNDLNALYEEYGRYIYHLCLKLTRNKEEAEDLMQDVWVKVVRYSGEMSEVNRMKAWLTTICMNTFRDRYRKNVRHSQYVMNQPDTLDVPILDLVPSNSKTPAELMEQSDISELVQQKIGELDGIYRKTIEYFYVNQYSLVEIAGLMSVSIGTVKSRLFRAKKYLKELLVQDEAAHEYVMA
ncbi:RNA polymerase sigma factor [Sporosarcina sp. P26b]|uniref:RNA polymerase sigma factor n=2 Tax=Caryophanaceae TaxID=186818 RepID=UPI000A17E9E5|nr:MULTISPECIES: RNA polymerase sigma factor [Sporosarcina]ARK22148.1 RNA polymerase subunit sigma-70 [Sporosarcina ureae]PIC74093.1 RNA polymerase sigma factor [Sporosarcina sp. P17b]PIC94919.1 RNA polymerase sigma factor [Sporosarcina sp. P26b]